MPKWSLNKELSCPHIELFESKNLRNDDYGSRLRREVNMKEEIKENDKEFVVEDMLVDDANIVMVHRS